VSGLGLVASKELWNAVYLLKEQKRRKLEFETTILYVQVDVS
jgi:hypothetical protein